MTWDLQKELKKSWHPGEGGADGKLWWTRIFHAQYVTHEPIEQVCVKWACDKKPEYGVHWEANSLMWCDKQDSSKSFSVLPDYRRITCISLQLQKQLIENSTCLPDHRRRFKPQELLLLLHQSAAVNQSGSGLARSRQNTEVKVALIPMRLLIKLLA